MIIKEPQAIIKSEYYAQPDNALTFSRVVQNEIEYVSYLKNSSVRIWLNRQPEDYDAHWHSALEIIIPLENICTVIVDNSVYVLHPGEIFIIPSKKIHCLKMPQKGSRLIFLFDPDVYTRVRTFNYINPLFVTPVLISERKKSEIYKEAYDLFLKMGNAYFEFGELRELMVYSLFFRFLILFGTYNMSQVRDNIHSSEKRYYKKFEYVIEYMNEHYQEPLTLEDMAEVAHFSKYHFARLFKQYVNQTFYDYLIRKRIEEAINLLAENKLSITDIALQTGFENISSFNRNFKKITGYNPKKFQSCNNVHLIKG